MDTIDIITDGACSGNPGRGGWAAIVVVAGTHHEYSGASDHTTNDRMELTAVIAGLQHAPAQGAITILCDSQYVINGITKWVHGWQRNNWQTRDKTPVENRDLWEALIHLNSSRVTWRHVKGHAGHPLNERANTLAQRHAGSQTGMPLRPPATPTSAAPTTSHAEFPCYISYVNKEFARHATWAECQQRVHGVSNAKFKKVANHTQLDAQRKQWGID